MYSLLCGDCYQMIKDIPDNTVDLIVTDPPYIIDLCGGGQDEISKKKKRQAKELSEISKGFDLSLFEEFKRIQPKLNLYIFCSKNQLRDFINYFDGNYLWDLFVWYKTNAVPSINNNFMPDVEYCFHARERKVIVHGTTETASHIFVSPTNKADKKKYNHPTPKPTEFIRNIIYNSSVEGDTILDCFMGSGTTGEVAVDMNRNFIGIEINKEYYDTAKQRIETADKMANIIKSNELVLF